ncbi:5'-3' exonuclease [Cerasibacillus terrae]|uniref:5'-3' exonuclease n=1 Tax=Cerasibacillus terrae TaxID=2498845 RepID=A0A5C8P3P6_9BACI|nr:5'-3' exonuclease H3TH domain-containing protein [Cerasibacillus terrae]TXL67796.1 5'-3' exonuclease [Cerasibacillus terrae]
MEKKAVMLVDGMALLFRGYYATAYRGNFMKTENGTPTNGVQQFLRYFLNAIHKFGPSHVICCWDMESRTFRTEMYEPYKANRSLPPEELVPQFDLVKNVVEAFDVPNIGLENYEADDCIGTLAKEYGVDHDVLILTGDHDILQLVDEQIQVAIMKKGQGNYEVYNLDNFYEKKGIYPHQMIDMKGLMGDTADNYPGVKGIGEKTARKLLTEYETIDTLLENIYQLSTSLQDKLQTDIDMLHLSRELAEIKCDIPITCNLDNAVWEYNQEKVITVFKKLQFTRLLDLV